MNSEGFPMDFWGFYLNFQGFSTDFSSFQRHLITIKPSSLDQEISHWNKKLLSVSAQGFGISSGHC